MAEEGRTQDRRWMEFPHYTYKMMIRSHVRRTDRPCIALHHHYHYLSHLRQSIVSYIIFSGSHNKELFELQAVFLFLSNIGIRFNSERWRRQIIIHLLAKYLTDSISICLCERRRRSLHPHVITSRSLSSVRFSPERTQHRTRPHNRPQFSDRSDGADRSHKPKS